MRLVASNLLMQAEGYVGAPSARPARLSTMIKRSRHARGGSAKIWWIGALCVCVRLCVRVCTGVSGCVCVWKFMSGSVVGVILFYCVCVTNSRHNRPQIA